MHTTVLLTLSVALSAVQARVARPYMPKHLTCHLDEELRALERYSSYSSQFCPEFLASSRKPRWLNHWNAERVSSACLCFEKTATTLGPTATTALAVLTGAPPGLTAVLATATGTPDGMPADTVPIATPAFTASTPSTAPSAGSFTLPVEPGNAVVHPTDAKTTLTAPSTIAPLSEAAAVASSTATNSNVPVNDKGTIPANTYPPQPFGAGPGKRGLIYDWQTQTGWSSLFKGSKYVTYGSDWALARTVNDSIAVLDNSFSFVPTIAVDDTLHNADWNATIPVLIEGGTKALFASNEPDNAGEANLNVADCVTVYKRYIQPYWGQVQLGTPAVTNGVDAFNGLSYLESFVKACGNECSYNFINVHHYLYRTDYTVAQYVQALKDHITKDVPALQAKYPQLQGLPIYIGEWWLWGASEAEGGQLMDALLYWLDNEPTVLGYQAFGGLWKGNFINDAGTGLSPAGTKYLAAGVQTS